MQSHTNQTIKIFWKASIKYPWRLIFLLLSLILGNIAANLVPFFQKDLINALSTNLDFDHIKLIIFKIYGLSLIVWFSWRTAGFVNLRFQTSAKKDLYRRCFEYIHGHSVSFFNNNFVGSLVRKINKYDTAYESITDQFFWSLIPASVTLSMVLFVLWRTNLLIAGVFSVWVVVYLTIVYFFALKRLKYDFQSNELDSKATGFVADTIANQTNLKLFASAGFEGERFFKITEQWQQALIKSWKVGWTQEAVQSALMVLLDAGIIFISIFYWSKGSLSVGEIVMIQMFMGRIFDKLWEIGRNIQRLYKGFADANEMTEILTTPHAIQDSPKSLQLQVTDGQVEFRNINLSYHKRRVLKDFSLSLKPKEKIALVGPSGGGKSTILKVLLRFMDPSSGAVYIDGQDIKSVMQSSLRKQISVVAQEPLLFHRSILENIRYAKPQAALDEVISAAKMANAHDFITKFEHGYETEVGERGVKLSGGERQRVVIARAILKNSPILVLDEATSSLDSESEILIQSALENLMKEKTVLVIAHRLSTIMRMDRIIVIENGKITEQGTHKELIKTHQGVYQKLWNIQAGKLH